MYPNQPYGSQPYSNNPPYGNMPPYPGPGPNTSPYPGQVPFTAPYPNNPSYGNMPPYPGPGYNSGPYPGNVAMGPQPVYRQITTGQGIDMNEFNSIVECCKYAFMNGGLNQLSSRSAEAIRQRLGGDWFVFISQVGVDNFDFSMTRVKGGDFMAFSLDQTKFQICRIR